MGRVKTKEIKKLSFVIIEKNPGKFNEDFKKNKQAVREMKIIDEKRATNKIAGYITKTMKRRSRPVREEASD
jgi:ribosomal protein S17E